MPLTNNALPSVLPSRPVPYDANTAFAKAQVMAATGYANNVNLQVSVGPGRIEGYWVTDISNMKVSAGNESYNFFLLGSNDAAFGNGNVDLIAAHDFNAAAAARLVPTITPANGASPLTGQGADRYVIPYSNLMGKFLFQYLQLQVVIAGTAPTVTFTSWITYDTED